MVRHDLPIVTVVLNNKAWGMCVHGQQHMFGSNRLVVTQLGDGRYDQVAQGFGCHGEFVEKGNDIGAAVRRALDSGRRACINIITDLDAVFGDTGQSREGVPGRRKPRRRQRARTRRASRCRTTRSSKPADILALSARQIGEFRPSVG